MNKSQFFAFIKSLAFKPHSISLHDTTVVIYFGDYHDDLICCKTEENAAKECHKFNRWLAEALETIKPSDTSWCPEPEVEGGFSERCAVLEPGYHQAKLKSVNLEEGKITLSVEAGEAVLNLPVRTYSCCEETEEEKQLLANGDYNRFELFGVDGFKSFPKCHERKLQDRNHKGGKTILINQIFGNPAKVSKQKSPEKMYIRATIKIMKMYDCFDSAKNPHWSNMSKNQKKEWARNFALEILEANIHEMAHDLSVDAGFDGLKNNFSKSVFKLRARQQIIDELDASEVEGMIEENLNCLW